MPYILFSLAGNYRDNDPVFLTSRNRKKSTSYTIFHRNDITTEILIDCIIFKKFFKYDRISGIYRNNLTFADIKTMDGIKLNILKSRFVA